MRVHLLLSGRCNLACHYCYQAGRRVRSQMSPGTARAALDRLLGTTEPPHHVTLSGGEPFLARPLLREIVSSLRRRQPGPAECAVLTNGTLVSAEDVDFLADHDVELQVSFDGVQPATAARGAGTGEAVLGKVRLALERRPDWAQRRLAVAMVVQAATVEGLAPSVERLMEMGVADIRMDPLVTHDPAWRESTLPRFEEQLGQVVATSLALWRRTRRVPVDLLRARGPDPESSPVAEALCRAASPESVTVDPDGRAWGCPVFATSLRRVPGLGRVASARLDLGSVLETGLSERLGRLPREAGLPLLEDMAKKQSSRRRCGECPFLRECAICPASTAQIPGNRDPHRVADHQCDFQYASLAARQRFLDQTAGPAWLARPSAPWAN